MITYLFGGRLGDFIHGCVIPSYIYDTTKEKAHILLSNNGDAFTAGIERTFGELKWVLNEQPWFSGMDLYNGQGYDIDMVKFRGHPLIEKQSWTDTYFSTFIPGNRRPPFNYAWMQWPMDNMRARTVVCHRGYVLDKSTPDYRGIIKAQDSPLNALFMQTKDGQWLNSGIADTTRLYNANTIDDMFDIIKGASVFIGDQSAPSAIACALGVPRIIELNRCKAMYHGEREYTDRMSTFHHGYVPYERTR